ncbi:MAG: hypothetical protein U9Q38_08660 [Thermodesulfobacteriota bacterium]|nr:hypothetical protein [Thermodesulfobacteriota bacterium]
MSKVKKNTKKDYSKGLAYASSEDEENSLARLAKSIGTTVNKMLPKKKKLKPKSASLGIRG